MRATASRTDTVEVGEEFVTITTSARSTPIVAGILGKEHDEAGKLTRIVLDTLIHEPRWQGEIGDFNCWGVFVTELTPKDGKSY